MQYLQQYHKLFDEAEAEENEELAFAGLGDEAGPSTDNVCRLRLGHDTSPGTNR